ncbi:MAG: PIN domain-containing protein [Bryobacterales bacterium]|nr:PIN domain-containing protein [Bryobacterales bacterium]
MSVEFVDTNILVYAHDAADPGRHETAVALVSRLEEHGSGALSTQVLCEFYSAATRKLGFSAHEAEAVIADFGFWMIQRPTHGDLLHACELRREIKLSWWDALILASALSIGANVLWSEDFQHGRQIDSLVIRNPFQA